MVNFKPTDEQELIRETMAGFAREVVRPAAREADEKGEVPESAVQRAWELGLVQSGIPESLGGYGDTRSAVTGAKTTSYAENVVALGYARARGADEALFLDTRGNLSEGTGSNVFVVLDGRLRVGAVPP